MSAANPSASPALLILAAGMGSRYGGLKQIDPMGPSGETVLDYSIFDALRAGFTRVVFVIRRELLDPFRAAVGSRWESRVPCAYAFQELSDVPPDFAPLAAARAKPWGTAHAIRAARRELASTPFAAINADDFYGADAFRVLAAHFASGPAPTAHAMAAFRLDQTLSEHGSVSRGVCLSAPDGTLSGIQEHTKISRAPDGSLADAADPSAALTGAEPVSMNCWGFLPSMFDELETAFSDFLASPAAADPKAEFTIPSVVDGMIRSGRGTIRLLPAASRWFGVTYREDRDTVRASIQTLVSQGLYPSPLA